MHTDEALDILRANTKILYFVMGEVERGHCPPEHAALALDEMMESVIARLPSHGTQTVCDRAEAFISLFHDAMGELGNWVLADPLPN